MISLDEGAVMLLMDRPFGRVEVGTPLTIDEYLALPEDTRAEIVDGVLRPMVRSDKLRREVQRLLAQFIGMQKPRDLRLAEEEVVMFQLTPPTCRIPDVCVFKPANDPEGRTNSTPARDVLLVVEVVSPSTATADRFEKPAEHARNEIPAFWRVELEPEIAVFAYDLPAEGSYANENKFGPGEVIRDRTLPWLEIPVDELLGDYA